VLLAWPALRENSATYDETEYVPAAYVCLTRGDYRLSPEHPPLLKQLFGLSLLSLHPRVSADAERAFDVALRDIDAQWIFGDRFLFKDNAPEPLLVRARLVVLALGAALVLLVFLWARDAFGLAGGILAATAAALDPNLLAHGTLATTDVGFTLFFVAALYAVRRTLTALSAPAVLGAAVAIAAAFAAKHTALLLVPLVLAATLLRFWSSAPWPVGRRAATTVESARGRALVLLALLALWSLATWGGIWAVYGFRYAATPDGQARLPIAVWTGRIRQLGILSDRLAAGEPMPDATTLQTLMAATPPAPAERLITTAARHRLLPESYLSGLAFATAMAQIRRSYLLGRISLTGFPGYFPFAFVVKTPLGTLLLLAGAVALLGLASLRRVRPPPDAQRRRDAWWLLLPPLVVMLAGMSSRLNIGFRHILPLVPFIYLLAGYVPEALARLAGRRTATLAVGAALLLLAAETLVARPYFLPFFNVAAGGSRGGLRLLSDSNLDWGQGLPALRRWMTAHDVSTVNLSVFGTADPAAYGLAFVPIAGSYELTVPGAGEAGYQPRSPVLPGYVAISATNLQGTYLPPPMDRRYTFLRQKEPVAVVADSIYVYWVERWGE
jgi:Dolichyl-phosphate-mannose-protein mannosyltransferase